MDEEPPREMGVYEYPHGPGAASCPQQILAKPLRSLNELEPLVATESDGWLPPMAERSQRRRLFRLGDVVDYGSYRTFEV